MIKAVYDRDELCASDGYYSGRIISMFDAYGGDYGFCRFYGSKRGSGMFCNSSAVFCGKWQDMSELEWFVCLNSPEMIELPGNISRDFSPKGYIKRPRMLFEIKAGGLMQNVSEPASLETMYRIVSGCFGLKEYDLWYADMSHRIRHEVSRAFLLDDCACACVDFVHEGKAYISQLAVSRGHRGKGFGGKLAGHIAGLYEKEGIKCFLWAYGELWEYYLGLGFRAVSEDNIYILKDNVRRYGNGRNF